MKDKFVFRYDKFTKKGILKTPKGEFKIDLEEKANASITNTAQNSQAGSGSCGGGYGLHLI